MCSSPTISRRRCLAIGPAFADRPDPGDRRNRNSSASRSRPSSLQTKDAAEAAAALVDVQAEPLPAVLSVEQALDPQSPLVQDPVDTSRAIALANTNVLREWTFGWGDTAGCLPHLVIEHEYRFPMVTHFAIEPHVFIAAPDGNGVTIWTPTQHPFVLQRVVAAALKWPIARVRIVAPDPGGGFGGKGWPKFEPLLAVLALRLGRPVRLVLTLEETFQNARRTSARIHARTGFDRDGRIVSQELNTDFLIGAYADIGVRVVSKASYAACGPYRTPQCEGDRASAALAHDTEYGASEDLVRRRRRGRSRVS